MKNVLRILAIVVVFLCNLNATPLSFEDEHYVTIFDRETLLGDCNFNLIRLYKYGVKPRFRKQVPTSMRYAPEVVDQLRVLQEHQNEIKPGKRIVAGLKNRCDLSKVAENAWWQENKGYFYVTFSGEVDRYLFERLEIASTVRMPEAVNTWNIPGEIIYFDEQANPCEVEIGSFQYMLDAKGNCFARCFKRHLRQRLVVDHNGILHCFTDTYRHLDCLAVGQQIDEFLAQRKADDLYVFSHHWTRNLKAVVAHYERLVGTDWV